MEGASNNSNQGGDNNNEFRVTTCAILDQAEDWISEKVSAKKQQQQRQPPEDRNGVLALAAAVRMIEEDRKKTDKGDNKVESTHLKFSIGPKKEKQPVQERHRGQQEEETTSTRIAPVAEEEDDDHDETSHDDEDSRLEVHDRHHTTVVAQPGIYAMGGSQQEMRRVDHGSYRLTPHTTIPMMEEEEEQQQQQVEDELPPAVTATGGVIRRPTEAVAEVDDVETTEAATTSEQATPTQTPTAPFASSGGASRKSLVEANPVSSGFYEGLAEAEPIDPTQIPPPRVTINQKGKEQHRNLLLLLALLVLLAVGLVVGSVLGIQKSNQQSTSVIPPSAEAPSAAPSTVQTAPPTPLALSGILNDLLAIVPNYTLQSLQDPYSPQSSAYHWLLQHHNITKLPQWRKAQLFALACFYFSFNGPSWPYQVNKDWLDDTKSECFWFSNLFGAIALLGNSYQSTDYGGILPCGTSSSSGEGNETNDDIFERLVLAGSEHLQIISPSMPPEIILLSSLKMIRLPMHNLIDTTITGIIPSQIFQMTTLEWIDFSHDRLVGTISTQFGLLTNMTLLFLHENSLSGTIPSQLGLCTQLQYLMLGGNSLTGTIPTQLGLLSNLKEFNISHNLHLEGPIPSTLGSLAVGFGNNDDDVSSSSSLRAVDISGNPDLTGTIPKQFCALTNTNDNKDKNDDPSSDFCSYDDYDLLAFWWFYGAKRSCSLRFDCTNVLCGCGDDNEEVGCPCVHP